MRKTYWIYTDSSLFELKITNEDRDVWKVYLEKDLPEIALQYAKVVMALPCVVATYCIYRLLYNGITFSRSKQIFISTLVGTSSLHNAMLNRRKVSKKSLCGLLMLESGTLCAII